MEKNIVKENNAGGLQIERYVDGKIYRVVWGLEFAEAGTGIADTISFGDTWVGEGDAVGASEEGNTDDAGDVITAEMAVDEDETTQIVAEYDGSVLTLYVNDMGHAARRYFGVDKA